MTNPNLTPVRVPVQRVRGSVREQLIQFFNMDHLEYGNMVMDYAYRYLELYLEGDQAGIRTLTLSKFFWQWWENQWNKRNAEFIERYMIGRRTFSHRLRIAIVDIYKTTHDITPREARPSPAILNLISKQWREADELYDNMITEVINKETTS